MVVVAPPRKGLNADPIEALHRMSPRRIVYVSCDPATLARDAACLIAQGYTMSAVTPVDMFPRTGHCEAVCAFRR